MYIVNFESNLNNVSLKNLCPTLNLIIGIGINPNKVLIDPLILLRDLFYEKTDNKDIYYDIDLIDNDTQYHYYVQILNSIVVFEELSKGDSILFRREENGSFTSISSIINNLGWTVFPNESFFAFCDKAALLDLYIPEILPVYNFLSNITLNNPDTDIYKLLLEIFSSQEDNPLILLKNIDANLSENDCITVGNLFSHIFPTLKSQSFIEAYSKNILDVIPLKYWQIITESKVCNLATSPHIFEEYHALIYSSLIKKAGVII